MNVAAKAVELGNGSASLTGRGTRRGSWRSPGDRSAFRPRPPDIPEITPPTLARRASRPSPKSLLIGRRHIDAP